MFQEDNIQEVVFLDTLEEQDYIFDQLHEKLNVAKCHKNKFEDRLIKEQDVVPFYLANNGAKIFNPPKYDVYNKHILY